MLVCRLPPRQCALRQRRKGGHAGENDGKAKDSKEE
jgi:hypothetical protein